MKSAFTLIPKPDKENYILIFLMNIDEKNVKKVLAN